MTSYEKIKTHRNDALKYLKIIRCSIYTFTGGCRKYIFRTNYIELYTDIQNVFNCDNSQYITKSVGERIHKINKRAEYYLIFFNFPHQ